MLDILEAHSDVRNSPFTYVSENQTNLALWTETMHTTTVGAVLHLEVSVTSIQSAVLSLSV